MIYFLVVALLLLVIGNLVLRRWRNAKVGTLEGKAIFITGCDTGFGRLMALSYSAQGALVFAGCLREEAAESLKKEARGDVVAFVLDVARGESVASAFDLVKGELEKRGKQLYGLVNNAGIFQGWLIEMTAMEEFRRVMDVNFMGVVMVTKTMLPLLSLEGRIVTITSVNGMVALPGASAYGASKFASKAFMDILRRELSTTKIKVIKIQPGVHNTNIIQAFRDAVSPEVWDRASANIKSRYPSTILQRTLNSLPKKGDSSFADPMDVVDTIATALLCRHPSPDIIVGKDAYKYFWPISLLPDEWADRCL